ncbi:hypothetical protein C0991_010789 [Blastosporella zonata]|nr:hypothetical protein C0991_010789 [Blastosporella zonata]
MTLLAPGLSTQLHPSVTSRIPNELYDAVISHFHADKPSLTTCTLVCSSWLPRARHLLLTSARITRHARARSFLELISAPRNLGTFAPVIRSLEIYSSARVNPKAHVQRLPALKRVYVSCVARYFGPGKCLQIAEWGAWFRPRAIQLTDLALGHATLGELLEFVEMLPEFEALRHLALIGVNWLDASLPSNEAHGEMRFPDIRSLILSGQSIHLVPYLSAHGVSITKLDLRVGRHKSDEVLAREAEDIHQYMCLLAPNIQELDLHDGSYQG